MEGEIRAEGGDELASTNGPPRSPQKPPTSRTRV